MNLSPHNFWKKPETDETPSYSYVSVGRGKANTEEQKINNESGQHIRETQVDEQEPLEKDIQLGIRPQIP